VADVAQLGQRYRSRRAAFTRMLTASCHIRPGDITTAAPRAGGQVELTHVTTLVAACLQPRAALQSVRR
jgi:hypothetical protein